MKVLVDTSIWSIALRHSIDVTGADKIREELKNIIDQSGIAIIGPIRQELLSGIKSKNQFNLLKKRLNSFTDTSLETDDFILAATFFNDCRSRGIQGSHIDFLLCAVASRLKFILFSSDKDFALYHKHLDFALYYYPV